MEKANLILKMEMNISVNSNKTKDMDKELSSGKQANHMMELGIPILCMD